MPALRRTLKPNGKAFFYENNAASDLLIWFRNNLVGKLGVPKYGDKDESPLAPQEIDLLRRSFSVRIQLSRDDVLSYSRRHISFGITWYSGLKAIDDFLYKKNSRGPVIPIGSTCCWRRD